MKTHILSLLLGLMLLLRTAQAQPARESPAVQEFRVGGDVTAFLVEDQRVPLVELTLVFPVGLDSAWARQQHAEEAFRIQLYDPAGALRARADQLAADMRLSMGHRESSLRASCHKDDLPALLDLVRDVLANRAFDKDELSRWQKSRELAWDRNRKEPGFLLTQAAARVLFQTADPRRRPFEAPDAVLKDVKRLAQARDQLIRMPGRLIGVAGAVTRAEAERLVAALLPPPLATPPPGVRPVYEGLQPEAARPHQVIVKGQRLTQVHLGLLRDSLTVLDPNYPAFLIADHVLGGHFHSRLSEALRHEDGDTYGAGTSAGAALQPDRYTLDTFTRSDNRMAAEGKLREVLTRLHDKGITEEERAGAADSLLGAQTFGRQSPEQVLSRALRERTLELSPGFFDRQPALAASIPLNQINAFVRSFYDPARYTLLRVEP